MIPQNILTLTPKMQDVLAEMEVLYTTLVQTLQAEITPVPVRMEFIPASPCVMHTSVDACAAFTGGEKAVLPPFSVSNAYESCYECSPELSHTYTNHLFALYPFQLTEVFLAGIDVDSTDVEKLQIAFFTATEIIRTGRSEHIPDSSSIMVRFAENLLPHLDYLLHRLSEQYLVHVDSESLIEWTGPAAADLRSIYGMYLSMSAGFFLLNYPAFRAQTAFWHQGIVIVGNPSFTPAMAPYTVPTIQRLTREEVSRVVAFLQDDMTFVDAVHTAQSI